MACPWAPGHPPGPTQLDRSKSQEALGVAVPGPAEKRAERPEMGANGAFRVRKDLGSRNCTSGVHT